MTKQQWIEEIQKNKEFAEHVYSAIVVASMELDDESNEQQADALASAAQTYEHVRK